MIHKYMCTHEIISTFVSIEHTRLIMLLGLCPLLYRYNPSFLVNSDKLGLKVIKLDTSPRTETGIKASPGPLGLTLLQNDYGFSVPLSSPAWVEA